MGQGILSHPYPSPSLLAVQRVGDHFCGNDDCEGSDYLTTSVLRQVKCKKDIGERNNKDGRENEERVVGMASKAESKVGRLRSQVDIYRSHALFAEWCRLLCDANVLEQLRRVGELNTQLSIMEKRVSAAHLVYSTAWNHFNFPGLDLFY